MTEPKEIRIGFVGAGRLAATLAGTMAQIGYRVTAIASRNVESARALARLCGNETEAVASPNEVLANCDLVFLTVPDGTIATVVEALSWEPGHRAVHCSGAMGLDVLRAVVDAGGEAGCLHPLQAFPSRQPEPERLRGITCGIEAGGSLGELLEQLATDFGASTVRLEGIDRALYHAAAVFASNYVVALASAARRAWTLAGLPAEAAPAALTPLTAAVSESVRAADLETILTGPVIRADGGTLRAHIAALRAEPDLMELYRQLARELLRVAKSLDPADLARLREVIDPGS